MIMPPQAYCKLKERQTPEFIGIDALFKMRGGRYSGEVPHKYREIGGIMIPPWPI